ncbi:uncharacterized protein LOC131941354 [Physella acuta]|uniref:uncharacterized protein LOC131941354 n=1 Tax=Physella acuta TaxID=109671 RepID=UPI0027DB3E98|nr:uncharacterized protein LOC131941354 [Physella acuta]XP_059156571.1 uncharacterized protein LOC131941354 [Physella acuta]
MKLSLLALTLTVLGTQFSGSLTLHTLDEYCARKLPDNERVIPKLSVYQVIKFCSDPNGYTECLLARRSQTQQDETSAVKLFEKQFPNPYDLESAAYLFCTQGTFPLIEFLREDFKLRSDCEKAADTRQCEIDATSADRLKDLEAAFAANNQADIEKHSCKLSLDYMKCIQAQYTKCNPKYDTFFLYKLARLGPACLSEHNFLNKLVTTDQCKRQYSTNGGGSFRTGVWSFRTWAWLVFAAGVRSVYKHI